MLGLDGRPLYPRISLRDLGRDMFFSINSLPLLAVDLWRLSFWLSLAFLGLLLSFLGFSVTYVGTLWDSFGSRGSSWAAFGPPFSGPWGQIVARQ